MHLFTIFFSSILCRSLMAAGSLTYFQDDDVDLKEQGAKNIAEKVEAEKHEDSGSGDDDGDSSGSDQDYISGSAAKFKSRKYGNDAGSGDNRNKSRSASNRNLIMRSRQSQSQKSHEAKKELELYKYSHDKPSASWGDSSKTSNWQETPKGEPGSTPPPTTETSAWTSSVTPKIWRSAIASTTELAPTTTTEPTTVWAETTEPTTVWTETTEPTTVWTVTTEPTTVWTSTTRPRGWVSQETSQQETTIGTETTGTNQGEVELLGATETTGWVAGEVKTPTVTATTGWIPAKVETSTGSIPILKATPTTGWTPQEVEKSTTGWTPGEVTWQVKSSIPQTTTGTETTGAIQLLGETATTGWIPGEVTSTWTETTGWVPGEVKTTGWLQEEPVTTTTSWNIATPKPTTTPKAPKSPWHLPEVTLKALTKSRPTTTSKAPTRDLNPWHLPEVTLKTTTPRPITQGFRVDDAKTQPNWGDATTAANWDTTKDATAWAIPNIPKEAQTVVWNFPQRNKKTINEAEVQDDENSNWKQPKDSKDFDWNCSKVPLKAKATTTAPASWNNKSALKNKSNGGNQGLINRRPHAAKTDKQGESNKAAWQRGVAKKHDTRAILNEIRGEIRKLRHDFNNRVYKSVKRGLREEVKHSVKKTVQEAIRGEWRRVKKLYEPSTTVPEKPRARLEWNNEPNSQLNNIQQNNQQNNQLNNNQRYNQHNNQRYNQRYNQQNRMARK